MKRFSDSKILFVMSVLVGAIVCVTNLQAVAQLPSAFDDYILEIIDPPDPNTTNIGFTWVNEAGLVVMQYLSPSTSGQGHTSIWEDGTWTNIDVPGSRWCGGSVPTADGRVGLTFALAGGSQRTAIYQRGAYEFLPDHPDYKYGINCITDYGLMCGFAQPRSGSNVRSLGVCFNASLSVFETFTVPGSLETVPLGINNAGQVVGYSLWKSDTPGDPEIRRAFLYDGYETFTDIVLPIAILGTTAESINESGDIVGTYHSTESPEWRGFLLCNGEFKEFVVPDSQWTAVDCINDHRQLSGCYADKDGKQYGYIATPRVLH